jgi:hypothetical protein
MMADGLFANAFPANPAHLLFLQEKYNEAHSRRRRKVGNPWDRPGINLNSATCFACFIRLRSGIANSLQSEPSARSWVPVCAEIACDYGKRMADQR